MNILEEDSVDPFSHKSALELAFIVVGPSEASLLKWLNFYAVNINT